jgi:predicted esterase
MVNLCNEYASRGYVAVSINYRLVSDDPPTPGDDPVARAVFAAIEDAANAMRWMRDNAATYGIAPDRIAVGGYSAGAITSLFLSYGEYGSDVEVQAVLSLSGGLYGFTSLIDSGDPPLFMVHGTEDTTVSFDLALAIEAAALAAPIPLEFYPLAAIGHSTPPQLNTWEVDGVTLSTKLRSFLYDHLDLAAVNGPSALVHVDFAHSDLETGSAERPWNSLSEALALAAPGGVIRINGASSVIQSAETFTGGLVIDQNVILEASPAGGSGVRIGVTSQQRQTSTTGFISRR